MTGTLSAGTDALGRQAGLSVSEAATSPHPREWEQFLSREAAKSTSEARATRPGHLAGHWVSCLMAMAHPLYKPGPLVTVPRGSNGESVAICSKPQVI